MKTGKFGQKIFKNGEHVRLKDRVGVVIDANSNADKYQYHIVAVKFDGCPLPENVVNTDLEALTSMPTENPPIRPMYDRAVIKMDEPETQTKSGIFIPDNAKEKPRSGRVIAIGPGRPLPNGEIKPCVVKAGDRVLYNVYQGHEFDLPELGKVIIMFETEILAILESA